jgi:FHS family L-fucose permease-like MFS transporter
VAILGPEHSAPVRLTLAQALNSLGGSLAPLAAGAFILADPTKVETQAAIANTVRGPYIAIAAGLLILGLAVAFSHLPPVTATQEFRPGKEGDPIATRSIWSYRHTVLGAVGIFFYVGVEVGLASIAVTKVQSGKLLGIFGFSATLLILVSMFSSGGVAIWTLVLCGFFNSIMFPNIFALGIAGLGPMTSKGSGLIMTAIVGGAIIPYLLGALADRVGIQHAFVIPMICYLYIAYYGLSGSKPKRTTA